MEKDTIYLQDCLVGMRDIPTGSVDLVITDLPYGVTRNNWDNIIPLNQLWQELLRTAKPTCPIILFAQGMFTALLMTSQPNLWRYNLIWEKTTPTGFLNAHRQPMRCHEDILVFYRKSPVYHPQMTQGHTRKVSSARSKSRCQMPETANYGHYGMVDYDSTQRFPLSILRFKTDRQQCAIHPTQKPVDLIRWLIRTYSNAGDTVLDCCMGSGTTAVAALWEGRHFIGFETNEDYWKQSLQRIKREKQSIEQIKTTE